MPVSKKSTWIDADEAPDMSEYDPDLSRGEWLVDGKPATREAGKAHARRLQGKRRINILLDSDVLAFFQEKSAGRSYQALINAALRDAMERETLEETLRRVIREEIRTG